MFNPVKEGLKRNSDARAYFAELKERVKRTGALTALEWNWYRARQHEWEPEILAAEMKEAARRINLDHARKLSIEDLQMVLAEKML